MAKRRMIGRDICRNDAFITMSAEAQALYFQLLLDADDDGIISTARGITAMLGYAQESLQELVSTRYLLFDESENVYIVKHWLMLNKVRSDRYTQTTYVETKAKLKVDEKGAYTFDEKKGKPIPKKHNGNQMATKRQPNDNQMATKCGHRLGKDSLGKGIKGNYEDRKYTDEMLEGLYKEMKEDK